LASLEHQARAVQAASRAKVDELLTNLRKRRLEFEESVPMHGEMNEAAWLRTKAELDAKWRGFEAEVTKYIETFSKQDEQQKAIFQKIAAAQLNAWQEASDKVHATATEFAAERRADIDAAVKQMKANASEAEATFQNLAQTGTASWTALTGALAQSRAVFRWRPSGRGGRIQAYRAIGGWANQALKLGDFVSDAKRSSGNRR
jgi:hypothetical protein